eukprot:gene5964-6908_t
MFGPNQTIKGGGFAKKAVIAYKSQLTSALARIKIKNKVVNNNDLLPESIRNPIVLPRYVRVNTLADNCKATIVEDVIAQFVAEGYTMRTGNTYRSTLKWSEEETKVFYQDSDFKEILIFASSVDLHDHELLLSGKIILQDKASCLPSYVLAPPRGVTALDSCSAPGNKTSLVSALMGNTGKVFAIEKDTKRMGTLVKLTKRSHCKNIEAINDSFFNIKWDDPKYAATEYILCDPSCSGSGIVNRLDHLLGSANVVEENDDVEDIVGAAETPAQVEEPNKKDNRKKKDNKKDKKDGNKEEKMEEKKEEKVALFGKTKEMKKEDEKKKNNKRKTPGDHQPEVIKTVEQEAEEEQRRCQLLADFQLSIIRHAFGLENEDVVKRALDELNRNGPVWRLANILPHWTESRGLSLFQDSEYCLRMSPEKDNTIGFFVACFEKIGHIEPSIKITTQPTIVQPAAPKKQKATAPVVAAAIQPTPEVPQPATKKQKTEATTTTNPATDSTTPKVNNKNKKKKLKKAAAKAAAEQANK